MSGVIQDADSDEALFVRPVDRLVDVERQDSPGKFMAFYIGHSVLDQPYLYCIFTRPARPLFRQLDLESAVSKLFDLPFDIGQSSFNIKNKCLYRLVGLGELLLLSFEALELPE